MSSAVVAPTPVVKSKTCRRRNRRKAVQAWFTAIPHQTISSSSPSSSSPPSSTSTTPSPPPTHDPQPLILPNPASDTTVSSSTSIPSPKNERTPLFTPPPTPVIGPAIANEDGDTSYDDMPDLLVDCDDDEEDSKWTNPSSSTTTENKPQVSSSSSSSTSSSSSSSLSLSDLHRQALTSDHICYKRNVGIDTVTRKPIKEVLLIKATSVDGTVTGTGSTAGTVTIHVSNPDSAVTEDGMIECHPVSIPARMDPWKDYKRQMLMTYEPLLQQRQQQQPQSTSSSSSSTTMTTMSSYPPHPPLQIEQKLLSDYKKPADTDKTNEALALSSLTTVVDQHIGNVALVLAESKDSKDPSTIDIELPREYKLYCVHRGRTMKDISHHAQVKWYLWYTADINKAKKHAGGYMVLRGITIQRDGLICRTRVRREDAPGYIRKRPAHPGSGSMRDVFNFQFSYSALGRLLRLIYSSYKPEPKPAIAPSLDISHFHPCARFKYIDTANLMILYIHQIVYIKQYFPVYLFYLNELLKHDYWVSYRKNFFFQ